MSNFLDSHSNHLRCYLSVGFLRSVLIVFVVYPAIYTTILGYVAYAQGGYNVIATTCAPFSIGPSVTGMCQCFIGVSILIFLLGISLKYIWRLIMNTRGISNSPQNRRAWITIRFLFTIFAQAGARVAFNSYYLVQALGANATYTRMGLTEPAYVKEVISASWEASVLLIVLYYLNAVVILWANKSLLQWLHKVYVFCCNDTPSTTPNIDEPKDIPLVDISSYAKVEFAASV